MTVFGNTEIFRRISSVQTTIIVEIVTTRHNRVRNLRSDNLQNYVRSSYKIFIRTANFLYTELHKCMIKQRFHTRSFSVNIRTCSHVWVLFNLEYNITIAQHVKLLRDDGMTGPQKLAAKWSIVGKQSVF